MSGVTVYFNGMGYWFEDAQQLMNWLDYNCDMIKKGRIVDGIEFDD